MCPQSPESRGENKGGAEKLPKEIMAGDYLRIADGNVKWHSLSGKQLDSFSKN